MVTMGGVKKILPFLATTSLLLLSACSAPSTDTLREEDPEGYAACIHFGGGLDAPEGIGQTNMLKAAQHGSQSSTEQISQAVTTQESKTPEITDVEAFKTACEAQGFDF